MDGNGRWATARGLPRLEGHRAGLDKAGDAVLGLAEAGVSFITLFSFSTENWKRPKDEIAGILKLLAEALEKTVKELDSRNIVIRHLGRLDRLALPLRKGVEHVVERTRGNTGAVASFAFDYGGRADCRTSCRGNRPTPSFISPTPYGRTSPTRRSRRPWPNMPGGSAASEGFKPCLKRASSPAPSWR